MGSMVGQSIFSICTLVEVGSKRGQEQSRRLLRGDFDRPKICKGDQGGSTFGPTENGFVSLPNPPRPVP